ncbi:MAG: PIN domain-containing protein [Euryarchaeota archaeon]|nr:PIN domain-containing protein [Euryarchaeota archaeon]
MEALTYLIDTWCWVEYLGGEVRVLKPILEGRKHYSSLLTLAEVSDVVRRSGHDDSDRCIDFIAMHSTILDPDPMIADAAGRTRAAQRKRKRDMGLMDALIYETAQANELVLLTGDEDFKGLDGVEFVDGD